MSHWLVSAILAILIGCGREEKTPPPAVRGDPAATKLRRGLTTADVTRILGAPATVDGGLWSYAGATCAPNNGRVRGDCVVGFGQITGTMTMVDGISPELIDLGRF